MSCRCVQFDDDEDEALAAAVALPWWRRWYWLLALVLPLTISALILAAGITVRVLYPQPVRTHAADKFVIRTLRHHMVSLLLTEGSHMVGSQDFKPTAVLSSSTGVASVHHDITLCSSRRILARVLMHDLSWRPCLLPDVMAPDTH